MYLSRLARPGSLRTIVCEDILDQFGPFFNEPRTVLEMELDGTSVYFSLLAALAARGEASWTELVQDARVDQGTASRYVRTLEDLQIVTSANPLFNRPEGRKHRYRVADHLIRFWFRFVFPYQADLTAGLQPAAHYERNIAPRLDEHVSLVFEDICREWVRSAYESSVDTVGRWWGLARHDLRREGTRTSEEIDVVGGSGRAAPMVGECKWTSRPMGIGVLNDLREYKLPALAQTGVAVDSADVVLFSRSGFTRDLEAEATRTGVRLVGLDQLLADLA